jgi:hypothetical protein
MAVGFREGFVAANGLRIRYRRGKGQAIIDVQGADVLSKLQHRGGIG